MKAAERDAIVAQIDSVLSAAKSGGFQQGYPLDLATEMTGVGAVHSAIRRYDAAGSYIRLAEQALAKEKALQSQFTLPTLKGLLTALRDDIAQDRTKGILEEHHAQTFGDYLEMADHLLAETSKDAAAVIAGSTLEAHLRALAAKFNVEVSDEYGKPKKADKLNADLVKADAYDKGVQKNITAWLDLRNNAAHGHYTKYEAPQVNLVIASVRDFIRRHPA